MTKAGDENRLDPVVKVLEANDRRLKALHNADVGSRIVYVLD